jgi:GxxExxY protein
MLRIRTNLSDELEALIRQTIGCCGTPPLGPGLRERIYTRAVHLELRAQGIAFEVEKRYPVCYRDQLICEQRVDLVIQRQLVVEIKSVEKIAPVHRGQVISYLRISKLPVGLLINFNEAVLVDGVGVSSYEWFSSCLRAFVSSCRTRRAKGHSLI